MILENASQCDENRSAVNENAPANHIHTQPSGDDSSQYNPTTPQKPSEYLKQRVSMRRLMEADGHLFKASGEYFMCCCPFHSDRTPSFSVTPDEAYGRCFGCDWHGDIFTYEMAAHGVDFRQALHRLEGKLERTAKTNNPQAAPAKRAIKFRINSKHVAVQEGYVARLKSDEWMQRRVCEQRAGGGHKWRPETIKRLAEDGSLGWTGDALAFIYRTGTKYRKWPGKRFFWDECNIGNSMWREHKIEAAQHIYLTEGETDAVTLVDVGLENDPGVAVIALPGASSFNSEWASMFAGKTVTLCFDSDDAGERGLEHTGKLLVGQAKKVTYIDLGEVA